MSILVQEVTKLYGEQKALDNVSFEIKTGGIVGFLGPNGAGKTTMMKIITGFIPATSGIVKVNGLEVGTENLEVRKKIGYLSENNPLYPEMYVREYLGFVSSIYDLGKSGKKTIDNIVELTGLGIEQKKKIGSLSKGYKQRVGLAQALIHNPDVLILDEPTTGLDPNQITEIRNLIRETGREKTIMLSTHIMQEVEAICDRIIIIDKGIIVANEEKSSIYSVMKRARQVIEVEFDREPVSFHPGQIGMACVIKKIRTSTFIIEAEGDEDIRPLLFRFAVENNITVLSLSKQENKLEDVFRHLTT